MTTPSSDLPVPGRADALAEPSQPVLPPTLMGVSNEDFLPGPGPWASALGRQLVVLLLLGSGALALWPMRETVKAAGVVRPRGENTVVQTELGGTVLRVLLRPNQPVRAGELLAVFDSRPLQAERRQLREELATLEGQLLQARDEQRSLAAQASALDRLSDSLTDASRRGVEQAQAALAFDRSELGRYRSLLESGAVPRSLVEEKQARQIVSQSEVLKALQGVSEQQARGLSERARLRQSVSQARSSADELRKQVAQRRTRLQQVQRGIELASVRAPISGSVLNTNLRHPGQVLQPGAVMAVLAPLGHRFELKLQVPADRISQLRVGQPATIKLSACPTAEFGVLPARVASVSADTVPLEGASGGGSPEAAAYQVLLQPERIALKGRQSSCQLRPGMEASADVVTRRTTVLAFLLNKLRLGS
jgi:multidrug efflux pump subunit AcrA (membrane-fusion protein)